MSLGDIPAELRLQVNHRDAGRCRYCMLSQVGQASRFHIDHIIPKSRGGLTQLENLALQCTHCSLHKAAKTNAIDPLTGDAVALFHPIDHTWRDHFVILAEGTCQGLSPIGRATVNALRMNDELALMARRLQIQLGFIFPADAMRN